MLQLTTVYFLISGSIWAVTHILALQFFLYWRFFWFDMAMHFLGGIVIGLLLYTLRDIGMTVIPERPRWFAVLFWTLMFAIVWEVYELMIGIPMLDDYAVDTTVDLVLGAVGGLVAYYIGNQTRTQGL